MSALTVPLSSVMSPVCLFLWVFYLFKVSLAKGLSLWFTSKELHCIDLGRGYFLASVLFAPSLIFIISSITEALAFASPIVLVLWHGGRCFNAFGFFRACPDCQQLPSWWFIHHTFSWVVCVDRFILVSFSVSSLIQKYAVQFPCLWVVFRAVFFSSRFPTFLHCGWKRYLVWLQFLKNLLRLSLWPVIWSVLGTFPCADWERTPSNCWAVCSLMLSGEMFHWWCFHSWKWGLKVKLLLSINIWIAHLGYWRFKPFPK